jgi:CBS domain-containing protein
VFTLDVADTARDAVLLMSRRCIRHVPVTEQGRVVSIVSEHDLFALQRLSLNEVSAGIRAARDVDSLRAQARDIRRLARNLLGQGIQARQLTELITHLNDLLTEQMVHLVAQRRALDLGRACWLAFGSEGRGEQTVTTDQDNGLVFESDDPWRDRPKWLALAREVNEALDGCGYPLCKGQVMASNPKCCLTQSEWVQRFSDWMEHGAPEDLLNAAIYFDLRAVAGQTALAQPLRRLVTWRASRLPRFIKQISDNTLRNRVPLNWRGGIDAQVVDGREVIDLKLQGTMLFVDAARLYALAHGIGETATRARFESIGRTLKVPPQESEGWIAAFEFLQMLRLKVQIQRDRPDSSALPGTNPNLVEVQALNEMERSMLKETLRVAHRLRQRIELDYKR